MLIRAYFASKLREDYVTGFTFLPVALFLSCWWLRLYATAVSIYSFSTHPFYTPGRNEFQRDVKLSVASRDVYSKLLTDNYSFPFSTDPVSPPILFLRAAYRGISNLRMEDYDCVGCNNTEVRNNIQRPNANTALPPLEIFKTPYMFFLVITRIIT